jgi:CRP-like cAMP-binding protein
MIAIPDALTSLPCFAGAPPGPIRAMARLWNWLRVAPGETVWRERDSAEELGVLFMGELEVISGNVPVGRVIASEMIGEVAAFTAPMSRSATLRATEASVLLMLPTAVLRSIRAQRHPGYEALVNAAVLTLDQRIATTDARIAANRPRLARIQGDVDEDPEPCPEPTQVFRRLTGFGDAPDAVLGELTHAMPRRAMVAGEMLCEEGDTVDEMWIVASGSVEIFRGLAGSPQRTGCIEAGGVIGANAIVNPEGGSVTAMCSRPGWLFRLDAATFKLLGAETRLRLREAMIGALSAQLRHGNRILRDMGPSAAPSRGLVMHGLSAQ